MARFTAANAREMAARSLAARKAAETERTASRASVSLPAAAPAGTDPFIVARLARVRQQLSRLDAMLEKETDPQKLDRLASPQFRLADQERILAGRPLPGKESLKSGRGWRHPRGGERNGTAKPLRHPGLFWAVVLGNLARAFRDDFRAINQPCNPPGRGA
jgi:hypothetical protein